jgi:hypothetical protein
MPEHVAITYSLLGEPFGGPDLVTWLQDFVQKAHDEVFSDDTILQALFTCLWQTRMFTLMNTMMNINRCHRKDKKTTRAVKTTPPID